MIAQRCNINTDQVFKWLRLFREPVRAAETGRYVPVVVGAAAGREGGAEAMHRRSEDVVAEDPSVASGIESIHASGARHRACGSRDRQANTAESMLLALSLLCILVLDNFGMAASR